MRWWFLGNFSSNWIWVIYQNLMLEFCFCLFGFFFFFENDLSCDVLKTHFVFFYHCINWCVNNWCVWKLLTNTICCNPSVKDDYKHFATVTCQAGVKSLLCSVVFLPAFFLFSLPCFPSRSVCWSPPSSLPIVIQDPQWKEHAWRILLLWSSALRLLHCLIHLLRIWKVCGGRLRSIGEFGYPVHLNLT